MIAERDRHRGADFAGDGFDSDSGSRMFDLSRAFSDDRSFPPPAEQELADRIVDSLIARAEGRQRPAPERV